MKASLSIYRRHLFLTLLATLSLAACSPHPGSGIWVPAEGSDAAYAKLEVLFEGQAELFVPGREEHLYRCFWGGAAKDAIRMECVSADNESDKPVFLFQVAPDGVGQLSMDGKPVGLFTRTNDKPTRQ